MKTEKVFAWIELKLRRNEYFSTPRNNLLALEFVKAKFNGGFGRLVFSRSIQHPATALKKLTVLRRIDKFFCTDFDRLAERDVLRLRDALNSDQLLRKKSSTHCEMVEHGGRRRLTTRYLVEDTDEPLSHRTKQEFRSNFVEFYRFVMEYHFQEHRPEIIRRRVRELRDITRYFTLIRPPDFQPVKVEFIPLEELGVFLAGIDYAPFRSAIQLSLMSAARPCELLSMRWGEHLYRRDDGEWIVRLPRVKGVSYVKFPFVVDLYAEELYPFFARLALRRKHGDPIFRMGTERFRQNMRNYTRKTLGRVYTPKVLRKTARMIRTNAGYSHDWINKLMGHSPNSKVQQHYLNYEGLREDLEARSRMTKLLQNDKMAPSVDSERRFTLQQIHDMLMEKTLESASGSKDTLQFARIIRSLLRAESTGSEKAITQTGASFSRGGTVRKEDVELPRR